MPAARGLLAIVPLLFTAGGLTAPTSATAAEAEPAIAFVSDRAPDHVSTVYLMSPDGSNVRPITRTINHIFRAPALAPDGRSLAVISTLGAPSGQPLHTGTYDNLNVIDASGTITRITAGGHAADPTFAPDGTRIAFSVESNSGTSIWTIRPDGSDLTQLTPTDAYATAPAYSADGMRIAYGAANGIVVMNSDGTNPVTVTTEVPDPGTSFGYATPAFSADGTRVVFARRAHVGWSWSSYQFYEVPASGGTETFLYGAGHGFDALDPAFSPDGGSIAFTRYVTGQHTSDSELYVVDADGSDQRLVATSPSTDAQPSWGVSSIVLAPAPVVVPPAPVHPGAAAGTGACAGPLPAGYNVMIGTAGDDNLWGTPGPDVIYGLGGRDYINGGGGNDLLCGGAGNDTLNGGAGNDRLLGSGARDRLLGGTGSDVLDGEGDHDYVDSGPGND